MRALASFIMRGPVYAAIFAAVPALLSVNAGHIFTLLLVYFSGTVIALVTLRLGLQKGLYILAVTLLAVMVMAQFQVLDIHSKLDLWHSIYIWVMAWLAAAILGSTASLALALQFLAAAAIVVMVVFFLVQHDPVAFWMQFLEVIRPILSQESLHLTQNEIQTMLDRTASITTGSIMAYATLGVICALLMGRAWQASLYHPGGLRKEFQQLRFGRNVGLVSLLIFAMMFMSQYLSSFLALVFANISIVVGLIYVIVGLAVVHGLVAMRANGYFWLVGVYALLILLGQVMAPMLLALALTDIWMDYRGRFKKRSG
jgi:hypothetical protein